MSKTPRRPFFSAFRKRDDAPSPPGTLEAGSTVGHYVIAEELGAGGMGIVYRAHDTRLDRPVALKFLPPHLTTDDEADQRLLVEARAAAGLDHPNICTIHEIGTLPDGRSFIAMAYYPGKNLTRHLEARGRLAPEEAVTIGIQVARGLGRAHAADIIHRDVKPANIFLVDDGPVKILDFGIAKVSGVEITREGMALGTIAYMSPEQIRGERLDARTDIWSLGVVLYEMCTGERPFLGADQVALMHGILELDVPPLDVMIPGFPPDLQAAIERCLSKDPRHRFPQIDDLIAALVGPATGTAGTGSAEAATPEPAPSLAEEGERRQATVLHVRWTGRGRLEERLSPDETDRLLEECRSAMAAVVEEHAGIVNRRTGDEFEALFGIPASLEDDAIRAVRAGAALCERTGALLTEAGAGDGVGVSCGIDSGRVVARRDETGGAEYRVVGEATELSARLSGQAQAGEVVISESCRRLVGPFFESAEAGTLRRSDDVTTGTFRVLGETGARSRLEATAEAEGLTTLAGRDLELNTLVAASRAAAAGQGRFVSIVGDAGAGKSRLLYEFARRIDPSRFDVIRGRCQSFGEDVPYLPFIDALKDRLDLSDSEGHATPDLVAERVHQVSPDLDDFTPFYLQLLSIADLKEETEAVGLAGQEVWSGEQHRVGLVESLSSLFTLAASNRPTIALFEDWHWVDTASRQVLEQLLEMISAFPLLVVVTARPDFDLGWGNPADHTPIVLAPLSPEDSAVVIRSSLAADEVPNALVRLLHDRAGGNPFFLEELCRALAEEGRLRVERGRVSVSGLLDNLELPDTVQGVLRTRLDRLDGGTRQLVRVAAVMGREFSLDVLAHALGVEDDLSAELDRLRDLGIIQQVGVVPVPRYRFKHALTQDVAYDGLLERQRAEVHGAVGEALEALRPDRLDDHLDRLAEHFASAGRWEKAIHYADAAADRRWAFSEFGEAAELLDRALEWVNHLPDDGDPSGRRVEILLRQERLQEYLGQRDRQQGIIDELLELLDPVEHADRLAMVHVRQGDLCILTRDHAGAEIALEHALTISRDSGNAEAERHALRSTGLLRWHQTRYEEAITLVERALDLDREAGNMEAVVGNLGNLGSLYRALGDPERALRLLHEALEVERSIGRRGPGIVVKETYILHLIAITHASRGERDEAYRYLEEARDVLSGSPVFNVVQMHYHLTAIARLKVEDGEVEEALALYDEAVSQCRRTRHNEGLSTSLRVRGDVLLNLERYGDALSDLQEAADLYALMHDLPSEVGMRRGVAVAQTALGNREAASEAWARTLRLARKMGNREVEIEALEGKAALARRDDPASALRDFEAALRLVEESDDLEKLGNLRYTIGILRWEFGAYEDALGSFEQAFDDLSRAGDDLHAGLVLNSIGRTLRDLGRFPEARARLEEAIALNERTGERLLLSHALMTLGDIALDTGGADEAVERFRAALELRAALGDDAGRGGFSPGSRARNSPGVRPRGRGTIWPTSPMLRRTSRTGSLRRRAKSFAQRCPKPIGRNRSAQVHHRTRRGISLPRGAAGGREEVQPDPRRDGRGRLDPQLCLGCGGEDLLRVRRPEPRSGHGARAPGRSAGESHLGDLHGDQPGHVPLGPTPRTTRPARPSADRFLRIGRFHQLRREHDPGDRVRDDDEPPVGSGHESRGDERQPGVEHRRAHQRPVQRPRGDIGGYERRLEYEGRADAHQGEHEEMGHGVPQQGPRDLEHAGGPVQDAQAVVQLHGRSEDVAGEKRRSGERFELHEVVDQDHHRHRQSGGQPGHRTCPESIEHCASPRMR